MTNYIYGNEIMNGNFDIYDEIDCFEENLKKDFQNSTLEIISKVAYLIGVPKSVFENEHQHPLMEVYEALENDKSSRILRHLCIIRNAIERGYKHLRQKMELENRSFLTLNEYVPQESIEQLTKDSVLFFKKANNTHLYDHIIELNRLISDRVNNCRSLFPLWLNWSYIKQLFIMPNGLTKEGTEAAAKLFYSNIDLYPYHMFINWIPQEVGNVLYNDKKFLSLLYHWNGDEFSDFAKVSDVSDCVKENIYNFIEDSEKIAILVDCENSDPYKLCGTLQSLDSEYTKKIGAIILFDDIHSASAWDILKNYTNIPVEYITIERLKENKSLVDGTLIAKACQLYYKESVDSFLLVSSDSDYFVLIKNLNARFLVMIEHDSCGPDLKRALVNNGIFYCYLDDFYTGNSEDIKYRALFREMKLYIERSTARFNINDMFREALRATRVEMTDSEKRQFFEKYIKTIQMRIDVDGNVLFEFKSYH